MSELLTGVDGPGPGVDLGETVEIGELHPGVRLRLGELNRDHVDAIALSRGQWPPILVLRADNTIVDGHYRYLAALKLGYAHIKCVYFSGGADSAFLEAIRRNREHGLPLSLREREAAARQVLNLYPHWSDRRVGTTCCLAPVTVRRIRATVAGSGEQNVQLNFRLGQDGRRHPADPRQSRDRIVTALRAQPEGSLREIARLTGTSPATVRAVKSRLEPVPAGNERILSNAEAVPRWPSGLVADAALLSAVEGKGFVSWFHRTAIQDEWRGFLDGIPISRVYEVADEARRRATEWSEFATLLESRVRVRRSAACL
jgi:ParB-like chromosome segregation protein Spo0J